MYCTAWRWVHLKISSYCKRLSTSYPKRHGIKTCPTTSLRLATTSRGVGFWQNISRKIMISWVMICVEYRVIDWTTYIAQQAIWRKLFLQPPCYGTLDWNIDGLSANVFYSIHLTTILRRTTWRWSSGFTRSAVSKHWNGDSCKRSAKIRSRTLLNII